MADLTPFTPSKKTASDFNNGYQYIDEDTELEVEGDGLQAETVNNLVESALYTQTVAESAMDLVESVVEGAYAPPLVGMHHIQFSGEPTPAEIWSGTTWEIDTDYQGRVLVGSGGDYSFGATGGTKIYNCDLSGLRAHIEMTGDGRIFMDGQGGQWQTNYQIATGGTGSSYSDTVGAGTTVGGVLEVETMQPYKVANYWKRTA